MSPLLQKPPRPNLPPAADAVGSSVGLTGLDPDAVREARAAGTSDQHLQAMAKLLSRRPGLGEKLKARAAKKVDALGESEPEEVGNSQAEEEPPDGAGPPAPTSSLDPVSQALVQLTGIVDSLAQAKTRKKSLDLLEEPTAAASGSEGGSYKGGWNAAILKALQKALKEIPCCRTANARAFRGQAKWAGRTSVSGQLQGMVRAPQQDPGHPDQCQGVLDYCGGSRRAKSREGSREQARLALGPL